jgi:hypothetical protein
VARAGAQAIVRPGVPWWLIALAVVGVIGLVLLIVIDPLHRRG